ncbi:hypothetical protein Tco_1049475, partial [Tanacetum coccineum]
EVQLHALVDGKKIIISEASVRRDLKLEAEEGGGPRCQETIRDTIAQTRFENVSKLSNDSLLARGNTLQSDEDRIKLNELMELCTNLQNKVLDLEKTKNTQANEIASSKRRVKKLEQKKRSRTHGLKRLRKGRIKAIDADKDITLVNVQDDADKEMYDVGTVTVEDDIQPKIEADHELAQRLQAEEQKELFVEEKAKLFQQLLEQRRKHFAAKSVEEKRNKPPIQAQQRKIMYTYLKNMERKKLKDLKNKSLDSIQKMFDRAFKRVNTFVDFRTDLVEGSSKRVGEELEQGSTKKQKVDKDKETSELESLIEVIPDEE